MRHTLFVRVGLSRNTTSSVHVFYVLVTSYTDWAVSWPHFHDPVSEVNYLEVKGSPPSLGEGFKLFSPSNQSDYHPADRSQGA